MAEPEMIVRGDDSKTGRTTGCQYEHPMEFCSECGCWMNCKRDGIDADYRRRPEEPCTTSP
jgi:hypothetical protein